MKNAAALQGSLRDFAVLPGKSFEARAAKYLHWLETRRVEGVWPYSKSTTMAPATATEATLEGGRRLAGVNFASQDYLSLSSHRSIKDTAKAVTEEYGVHSAGSSALMGNTRFSCALEEKIAAFNSYAHALAFPTGWAAGFGVIRGLVRPHDHVVIDALAHASLREGVHTATEKVHNHKHLDVDAVREILRGIRASDNENAILVVTESLFSMDSDTPDLRRLQDACREFEATLLVDCAHDLGALGRTGRGLLEDQDMVGKVDLLMGSFSKTFASNGGFVACNSEAIKQVLKSFSGPQTFSNALSPVQAAVITRAFEIVESDEGATRRKRLKENILALHRALDAQNLRHIGVPSPIVPVLFESVPLVRLVSKAMLSKDAIVNFAEFPAVPMNAPRMRLQVQADHTEPQIQQLVRAMVQARTEASAELARLEATGALVTKEVNPNALRVG